MLIACNITLSM